MTTLINKKNNQQETDRFFIPELCQMKTLLIVIVLAELLALLLSITNDGLHAFSWESFGMRSMFVQWVVLISAGGLCLLRRFAAGLRPAVAGGIAFAWILIAAAFCSLFVSLAFSSFIPAVRDLWWFADNVVSAAIIGGMVLRYLYVQEELRWQQQVELNHRIRALQARIRPHFLFNSMNSIASLIAIDPEKAERAVEDLAELFRASLKASDDLVALRDELKLCQTYIGIEQLRLGDRLHIDWQVDESLGDTAIPHLCLQPLMENAIYHGIQPIAAGGTVHIQVQAQGESVVIEVINPLPGQGVTESRGNNMALENIRHRLHAWFGKRGSLVTGRQGDVFVAVLTLPKIALN